MSGTEMIEAPAKKKRTRKRRSFAIERLHGTHNFFPTNDTSAECVAQLVEHIVYVADTADGKKWIEKNGIEGAIYRIVGESARGTCKAQTTMKFE